MPGRDHTLSFISIYKDWGSLTSWFVPFFGISGQKTSGFWFQGWNSDYRTVSHIWTISILLPFKIILESSLYIYYERLSRNVTFGNKGLWSLLPPTLRSLLLCLQGKRHLIGSVFYTRNSLPIISSVQSIDKAIIKSNQFTIQLDNLYRISKTDQELC